MPTISAAPMTAPIDLETTLDHIEQAARDKWGDDRWLIELVRAYNTAYTKDGDTNQAYNNRSTQFKRFFAGINKPGIDLVFALAGLAGLTIKIE